MIDLPTSDPEFDILGERDVEEFSPQKMKNSITRGCVSVAAIMTACVSVSSKQNKIKKSCFF